MSNLMFELKTLSAKDLRLIMQFCQQEIGLYFKEAKKELIVSRIRKCKNEAGFSDFSDYLNYVLALPRTHEDKLKLIDSLTTNTTSFFREKHHFNLLSEQVLPEFVQNKNRANNSTFRVWSAGCSTGAEPYTLAMVLQEFKDKTPGFNYEIIANDISLSSLARAQKGIYPHSEIETVGMHLRKKYLLRSKHMSSSNIRISPQLMQKVQFLQYNMLREVPPFKGGFDAVFCRNVMIYFNKQDVAKLIHKFYDLLKPEAYLFIGHSESVPIELTTGSRGFKILGSSTYQKRI